MIARELARVRAQILKLQNREIDLLKQLNAPRDPNKPSRIRIGHEYLFKAQGGFGGSKLIRVKVIGKIKSKYHTVSQDKRVRYVPESSLYLLTCKLPLTQKKV